MAIAALHSAATGLKALSTSIDVIANNLANAETGGFKSSRVNFEDLMYESLRQPGVIDQASNTTPAGLYVGMGVRISNTQLDMDPGSLTSTDRQLDVAVNGQGFFQIKTLPTVGNGIGYTRNGNFFTNSNGQLIVGMGDGYQLIPPITVPTGVTNIAIGSDGTIQATVSGQANPKKLGQLQLTQFINPQGLQVLGGSIYLETPSSGKPLTGNPGDNGTGTITQGYLESSNVDPVSELVNLIQTQRSFELNSQSIQVADQALQTIGNLRRG